MKAGLTQAQAADLACVTTRAWQQYESGDRIPSRAVVELFKLKIQIKEKDEKMKKGFKKINCIEDAEKLFAQDGWTHESVFEDLDWCSEDDQTSIRIEVHSKLGDIEIEYLVGSVTICNKTKEIVSINTDPRDEPDFPSYVTISRGIIIQDQEPDQYGEIGNPCFEETQEFLDEFLPVNFVSYEPDELDNFIKSL